MGGGDEIGLGGGNKTGLGGGGDGDGGFVPAGLTVLTSIQSLQWISSLEMSEHVQPLCLHGLCMRLHGAPGWVRKG